jgi:hypothetical protein
MASARRPNWADVRDAVVDSVVLAVACLVAYLLVTQLLSRLYFISTLRVIRPRVTQASSASSRDGS